MSEPPSIIRQEPQHSVTVTEGMQVATSKPSDPIGPQVRQNFDAEGPPDAQQPAGPDGAALPPPMAHQAEPETQIFERRQDSPQSQPQMAPPALAQAGAQEAGLVFERSVQDSVAQIEPLPELAPAQTDSPVDQFLRERRLADQHDQPADAPAADPSAPVIDHSLQDRFVPVPDGGDAAQAPAQGPVIDRSVQDRFVPIPEAAALQASADGPVFERSQNDHKVAAAPLPARLATSPVQQVVRRAPREGSSAPEAPRAQAAAPEPVPLGQAQQIIGEAARQTQSRVEEIIGAADQEWVEMDFPARVVKLKIENDKVRTQLDQLDEMAEQQRRR